jgi:acyl-coenzyme A thioesterase PaaI-like protein
VRSLWLNADGSASAEVLFDESHEGGPGVVHGGWTAAMFDEVLGLTLNRRLGMPAVTRDLTVRYLRPVPVGHELLVEAWGEPIDGRGRWQMHGRLLLSSGGAELGGASGIWVQRDGSHYERHQQWLRDQALSEG